MDEKSKSQTIDDPHQDLEIESVGVVKSQSVEDRLKVLEDNIIGQDTWRKHCLRLTDTQMNVKVLIHELRMAGILTDEMLINIDYQHWKEEGRVKLNETKITKLGPCDCDPCIGQVLEVECDKCLRIIRAALAIPRMKSIITNTNENILMPDILMPDKPCPQCGGRSIPDEGGYYFCIEPRCGKGHWYPAKSKDISTEDVPLPLDHMPNPECSCEECREWFKLPPAEESNLFAKMADPIGYWQTEDAGVTSTGEPPVEEPTAKVHRPSSNDGTVLCDNCLLWVRDGAHCSNCGIKWSNPAKEPSPIRHLKVLPTKPLTEPSHDDLVEAWHKVGHAIGDMTPVEEPEKEMRVCPSCGKEQPPMERCICIYCGASMEE